MLKSDLEFVSNKGSLRFIRLIVILSVHSVKILFGVSCNQKMITYVYNEQLFTWLAIQKNVTFFLAYIAAPYLHGFSPSK